MNEIRGMEASKRLVFLFIVLFNSSIDKERKMSEFRGHKAVKRKKTEKGLLTEEAVEQHLREMNELRGRTEKEKLAPLF